MRYRIFPGTTLSVSEIGFGTWTLSTGWWGEKTDEQAVEMLRMAQSVYGINFFDTADTYGNGRGERQLADAFRDRRGEVVYATKIGYDIYNVESQKARRGQNELPQRFDRDYMRFALDKSLERLETDHIDVLQLHNIKMEHVRDASIWKALREMKDEGLIGVWGAAFGPAIGWLYEAVELCERENDIGTIQMIWNILEQHPGASMIDAAKEFAPNCCFNVRVTHASGMLEGKYTEDTVFPENDHRRHRPRSWLTNGVKKVRTLDFLTTDMTLGQAALKWLLDEPLVVTTLPNIYDMDQLREFAEASDKPDLTPAQLERVAVLASRNFGVEDDEMTYKGTMERVST
ncbi:MAG TPA: aldo/keto reductase [Gemmatimonadaceae bacterium]|jgi:aryl-alcohol dehydrogenase-like predicted oxidoreductase|nr:aldo/keto reductase [Gemmatimonadaceae bacterium]